MNETDTLRGLIAKARRERDKSVRQLALTAQEAGHKIVGTTLNAIEGGTYKSVPTAETIRAIGWLAGVTDEIAFAAAGRSIPGPPFAEELPPGVDDLTSPERRAAIAMLRALVAQRQEINRYVDQPSSHPAAASGAPDEAPEDQEGGLSFTDIGWGDLPPVLQLVDDERTSTDEVTAAALLIHYREMYRRAMAQSHHNVMLQQELSRLGDSPATSKEPEIEDGLYVQYVAARLSTKRGGGDPDLHAAVSLTKRQYAAAKARYERESAELVVFRRLLTRGCPPVSAYSEPPEQRQVAARTAPPGYRTGQSEQGDAAGEETQDPQQQGDN